MAFLFRYNLIFFIHPYKPYSFIWIYETKTVPTVQKTGKTIIFYCFSRTYYNCSLRHQARQPVNRCYTSLPVAYSQFHNMCEKQIKIIAGGIELKEYCLIFDEEFLLKRKAVLNPIASYLYGYQEHGQPLCGNVLVMKNYITPDNDLDTVGLTEEDISIIENFISQNINDICMTMKNFSRKYNI